MDAGLYAVRRMQRLDAKVEKMTSVLRDARHAILWLSNPQLRERGEDRLPRTDIVEAIDALLNPPGSDRK